MVNTLSDDVSIVDLTTLHVTATLRVGDEPSDVVFAGSPQRAWVSVSQEDAIKVYDPTDPTLPPQVINVAGRWPRALSVTADGAKVFCAIFNSNHRSTALSEYILSRASRENPFDLIGAMFIIEGLGRRVAGRWGEQIREQLGLEKRQVSFLTYHSASDDIHFERLDAAVQSGILTEALVADVVKAARVTARLYMLQLEEIGNF